MLKLFRFNEGSPDRVRHATSESGMEIAGLARDWVRNFCVVRHRS